MDKKINLKKQLNVEFFELPKSKAKSYFLANKFSMSVMKISTEEPEIFISNKTSDYDKYFLSNSIETSHVFLKDEIIRKLYNDEFSIAKLTELNEKINELFNLGVSLVIFPEKHRTIFGDYEAIPEKITNFIKCFGKRIRFFSLINTYFIKPVWLAEENKCETKIEQRFGISSLNTKNLTDTEFNEKFNGFMPSSASTYIKKYPLFLRGRKPAENLESIIYACPNCKKLFSLYSEISCVKCEDCGTAFELSETGELSLTHLFDSFDSAKEFQKFILMKYNFENKLIVGYKNIIIYNDDSLNKKTEKQADLLIFADHITLKQDGKYTEIEYKDIFDIELKTNNVLIIYLAGGKKQIIQGRNKENFYVIFDLINIKNDH